MLVFAKAPVAGQVKTRLIPALGVEGATRLYRKLLCDRINRLVSAQLAAVELWCAPDACHEDFLQFGRLPGLTLHQQQGKDLGQRMAHATADAWQRHRHLILLGIDCPALTDKMLEQGLDWLAEGVDAVLGPAEDGGYVLLGLNRTADCLFQGIPWGTEVVGQMTRQCLRTMDWDWRELPELWDLDRPEDLSRLAASGFDYSIEDAGQRSGA